MKRSFLFLVIVVLTIAASTHSQSLNTTWVGSIYTYSRAFDVKVVGRYAYVVGWNENFYGNMWGSFSIIDVQTPANPNLISAIYINDAYGIDIKDNFAFIAEGTAGLSIYNIANQFHPTLIGQLFLPGNAKDVKIVENFAYVADEYAGLRIIDISNVQNPVEVGYFDSPGRSFDVEIKDTLAFLADLEGGLICLNISDPSNPSVLNIFPASDTVVDVDLVDSLAYFTDGYSGIKVVNIANPTDIFLVDELYLPYWCLGIKVSGSYAYVAAWEDGGLRIIDISNPENIKEVGYYNTSGKSRDVDVVGALAYLSDWGPGLTIINNNIINPVPVELVSFTAEYDDGSINLSWVTATVVNNLGFEIERKTETENWSKVAFIKGNGTTTEIKNYFYTDYVQELNPSKLFYRLKQIDSDGSSHLSKVIEINVPLPVSFKLEQNYPNPFNPTTKIRYRVPIGSDKEKQLPIKLIIYDTLGNEVATLVNELKVPGYYEVDWNASNLASGVYLYQLQSESIILTKKMMLMR